VLSGGYRRLHNEELHNLYTSPNIRVIKSRRIRWAGFITFLGKMRNAYKILIRKLKGKILFGRLRHKWEDNFRMNFREIRCKGVEWMNLSQDRDQWWALANTILNPCSIKGRKFLD
jgi:hypothetical protein